MSYGDKKRAAAPCRWPQCDQPGTTLALDPRSIPQWFCPGHAATLKAGKK